MHSRCLHIDTDLAHRHLAALDDLTVPHIFVCVPEVPGARGCVRHICGTLQAARPRLKAHQRAGCGVFVTVNAMRGRRRLKSTVGRVRAMDRARQIGTRPPSRSVACRRDLARQAA